MHAMDLVFKALADPGRRALLDRLYAQDGQTLSELCGHVPYSRQALSKHLVQLQQAGLVVSHFAGREKLHYLNALPIQEIASRWLQKFDERQLSAVAALKRSLEDTQRRRL
jgi:DNA-binding transcriptional ArsR family regulator